MSSSNPLPASTSKTSQWGGARPGAGRPRSSDKVPHLKRPIHGSAPQVFKIEIGLHSAFGSFSEARIVECLHKAMARAKRHGLRFLHYGLTHRSLRLIAEAQDKRSVEATMRSLTTSLAKQLWKLFRQTPTRHKPFRSLLDRYRLEALKTKNQLIQELRHLFVSAPDWIHNTWRFFNRRHRIQMPGESLTQSDKSPCLPFMTVAMDTLVLAAPMSRLARSLAANDYPLPSTA